VVSNGGSGERPRAFVLSWWGLRGSLQEVWIWCFSPCQVEGGVAAALRRWVPHGGGLLVRCGLFFSRVPVDAGHGGRFQRQL